MLSNLGQSNLGQSNVKAVAPEALQSLTFESVFRFRRIKPPALDSIVQSSDMDETVLRNMFAEDVEKSEDGELVSTGWIRRKEEKHQLELPAWLPKAMQLMEDVDAKHLESVVQRHIEEFVKTEFIDNYQPVGAHDWSTIALKASTSTRRGSFSIDDAVYKDATASIVEFIVASQNAAPLRAPLTKALEGKFTRAAIQRNLGAIDEGTLNKLKAHLDNWASYMVENNPELANDYAEVYEFLNSRIDTVLGGSNVNLASML